MKRKPSVSTRSFSSFSSPNQKVFLYPGWDIQPFERISPQAEVMGQRWKVRSATALRLQQPAIVVASLRAVLQRVPPRADPFARSPSPFSPDQEFGREELDPPAGRDGLYPEHSGYGDGGVRRTGTPGGYLPLLHPGPSAGRIYRGYGGFSCASLTRTASAPPKPWKRRRSCR